MALLSQGPAGPARAVRLTAGIAALVAFAWALLAYDPVPAAGAALAAVALLSWAAPRRWRTAALLALPCAALLWAAFGTTAGYFWLNRVRLEAVVVRIGAIPAIHSLELGHDEALPGGAGRYDSYRFINGQLVSQYRTQEAPGAEQPVLREVDVLRDLGVAPSGYHALRAALARLSLSGFDRGPDGEIALNERGAGGAPWITSFLYRPVAGFPADSRVMEQRRLARHWFHILRG